MILSRIITLLAQPDEETRKQQMNEQQMHAQRHEEWLKNAQEECKKRFLRIEPTDVGEGHWRIFNSGGELVFPQHLYGGTKAMINGYFLQNPQA